MIVNIGSFIRVETGKQPIKENGHTYSIMFMIIMMLQKRCENVL